MSAQSQILISTSDVDFYLFMDHILKAEGFEVSWVSELQEIQQAAADRKPSLIIQDHRPDNLSALDIYRDMRQSTQTRDIPLLILIEVGAVGEHVRLLKSGIDEIMARPVSPDKLLERIGILLGSSSQESATSVVSFADVEMNLDKYTVRRAGREIDLSPTEFRLLRHLLEHPGQIFSREDLIDAAWPSNVYVVSRTVDVHMGRLRKALKQGADKDLIRTVRSVGYGIAE